MRWTKASADETIGTRRGENEAETRRGYYPTYVISHSRTSPSTVTSMTFPVRRPSTALPIGETGVTTERWPSPAGVGERDSGFDWREEERAPLAVSASSILGGDLADRRHRARRA